MKLFFDSSIIIETFKGNERAVNIIKKIKNFETDIYINEIVFSEVTYQLTVRKSFELDEIFNFLNNFLFLNSDFALILKAQNYMKKYNLKPNDSIIAATVKYYNLDYLATLDNDYENLDIRVFE